MSSKNKNEQAIAGANYIINFYQEVETLISVYSQYDNLVLELETKSQDREENEQIEEQEAEAIKQASQTTRYYIKTTYIKFSGIARNVKIEDKEYNELTKLYNKINKTLIVNRDDIKEYTIELNRLLLKNVIKTLLEDSSQILQSIYSQ